jgi:hypothetical protein
MKSKKTLYDLFKEVDELKKSISLFERTLAPPLNNYKIPEVGGKIFLWFYLFVECKFNENKCYLNLNGDFEINTDNSLKNLIFPFKCSFVRINNPYNPNKIILKSCLTNKDIIKKLPLNFSGSFTFKFKENDLLIEKVFVYNLMEIKNSFQKDNRITIKIDKSIDFDQMIEMSKKVKKDYMFLLNQPHNIEALNFNLNEIRTVLVEKKKKLVNSDEFEKADMVKKDIAYLDKKNKQAEEMENKTITYREFIKKFHLNLL